MIKTIAEQSHLPSCIRCLNLLSSMSWALSVRSYSGRVEWEASLSIWHFTSQCAFISICRDFSGPLITGHQLRRARRKESSKWKDATNGNISPFETSFTKEPFKLIDEQCKRDKWSHAVCWWERERSGERGRKSITGHETLSVTRAKSVKKKNTFRVRGVNKAHINRVRKLNSITQ